MTRHKIHFEEQEPQYCWVGERQKVCYATKEEAEVAAGVVAYDHGVKELSVYKCEFGDHWHLTRSRRKG